MVKCLSKNGQMHFFTKHFLRGLVFFVVILIGFLFTKGYIRDNLMTYVSDMYENKFFFYGLFIFSEVAFGLIPPEFFMMIYILNEISLTMFVLSIFILTLVSYMAGVLDYFVGRFFSNRLFFKRIEKKFLVKYQHHLKKYGTYLVIVGAITPIPFSAVCMLVGSAKLPVKPFLLVSTSRVLRFVVYGAILWGTPIFVES